MVRRRPLFFLRHSDGGGTTSRGGATPLYATSTRFRLSRPSTHVPYSVVLGLEFKVQASHLLTMPKVTKSTDGKCDAVVNTETGEETATFDDIMRPVFSPLGVAELSGKKAEYRKVRTVDCGFKAVLHDTSRHPPPPPSIRNGIFYLRI